MRGYSYKPVEDAFSEICGEKIYRKDVVPLIKYKFRVCRCRTLEQIVNWALGLMIDELPWKRKDIKILFATRNMGVPERIAKTHPGARGMPANRCVTVGGYFNGTANQPIIILNSRVLRLKRRARAHANIDRYLPISGRVQEVLYHEIGHAIVDLAISLQVDSKYLPKSKKDEEGFCYYFSYQFICLRTFTPEIKKILREIRKKQR